MKSQIAIFSRNKEKKLFLKNFMEEMLLKAQISNPHTELSLNTGKKNRVIRNSGCYNLQVPTLSGQVPRLGIQKMWFANSVMVQSTKEN